LRTFGQEGNQYLVLEKLVGRPLLSQQSEQPSRPSWRRAQRILDLLGHLLSELHSIGWVWRDCKPAHIFLYRGAIRLIDFEGACRIDETDVLPWGSPNHVPPIYHGKFSRRPGTLEDDYALGVIAFQFLSGEFPASSSRRRASIYKETRCPDPLRSRIESLLRV
jgi:serine/threonine protein kinase